MLKIKKGFYKSYKHDPSGKLGNNIFEVLNLAHSTSRKGECCVVYRPLDQTNYVYTLGKQWDEKLIDDFLRPTDDGQVRYQLITDSNEIAELTKLRDLLYRDESDILIIP